MLILCFGLVCCHVAMAFKIIFFILGQGRWEITGVDRDPWVGAQTLSACSCSGRVLLWWCLAYVCAGTSLRVRVSLGFLAADLRGRMLVLALVAVCMAWVNSKQCAALCLHVCVLKTYVCGGRVVQVPMYSASGLRVQYLKVWEKSNYKVEKWVRKVCKSGDYMIRT